MIMPKVAHDLCLQFPCALQPADDSVTKSPIFILTPLFLVGVYNVSWGSRFVKKFFYISLTRISNGVLDCSE